MYNAKFQVFSSYLFSKYILIINLSKKIYFPAKIRINRGKIYFNINNTKQYQTEPKLT